RRCGLVEQRDAATKEEISECPGASRPRTSSRRVGEGQPQMNDSKSLAEQLNAEFAERYRDDPQFRLGFNEFLRALGINVVDAPILAQTGGGDCIRRTRH